MSDLTGRSGGPLPPSGRTTSRAVLSTAVDDGLRRGTVDSDRLRRRARFLRELSEARALRERVQPRRARVARMRQQMRMRTFRW
ncbi:hypothetical protein MTQ01_01800 [Streptomyces sp. XM4193]|uniref:hypothetical protein n=1 Tax=Streptomyces sp. XM4193 TaxID=2929782 RepID=UPI001FFB3191|nr:hypothetical protein [Streptomyces sp. XM4193]MCK1794777.1 hypothetical protein [Streptomyces sp. XM4193]